MPLSQTTALIEVYGDKLKSGNFSDEDLLVLLSSNTFTKSAGYVNPNQPITNSNHSKMDAIKDFVRTIAPTMEQSLLHDLTSKVIKFSPQGSENEFMRGSTLEKAFLAYEMLHYPEEAEKHFSSERIKKEFYGKDEESFKSNIMNLKNTILTPIIEDFLKPVVESVDSDPEHKRENIDSNDKHKLNQLIQLCSKYKAHLKLSDGFKEENNLTGKKYAIVTEMLKHLEAEDGNDTVKINNMGAVLTDSNKAILKAHRNPQGVKFLETILHVLTFGLYSKLSKGTFEFWKSHGDALVDKLEENKNNTRNKP